MEFPDTTTSLEACGAVMIGLGARRFVIVRREGPRLLRAVDPQRHRVRDLVPGDEVIYKGQRQVVRSLQAYP